MILQKNNIKKSKEPTPNTVCSPYGHAYRNYIPSQENWSILIGRIQKLIDRNKSWSYEQEAIDAQPNYPSENLNYTGICKSIDEWMIIAIGKNNFKVEEKIPEKIDTVQLISCVLGFNDTSQLDWWAEFNPELWGNENGGQAFTAMIAYDETAFSLECILYHVVGVAKRCKEAELNQNKNH